MALVVLVVPQVGGVAMMMRLFLGSGTGAFESWPPLALERACWSDARVVSLRVDVCDKLTGMRRGMLDPLLLAAGGMMMRVLLETPAVEADTEGMVITLVAVLRAPDAGTARRRAPDDRAGREARGTKLEPFGTVITLLLGVASEAADTEGVTTFNTRLPGPTTATDLPVSVASREAYVCSFCPSFCLLLATSSGRITTSSDVPAVSVVSPSVPFFLLFFPLSLRSRRFLLRAVSSVTWLSVPGSLLLGTSLTISLLSSLGVSTTGSRSRVGGLCEQQSMSLSWHR